VTALAFAAVIGALIALFGIRGWLLGLHLAAVQVAASGLGAGVDGLPGPLAFLHPLLPMSWATDALRTSIRGGPGEIAVDLVVLAGWMLIGLLVGLAATAGARSRDVAAAGA
jgi:putative membrane protein